jgi:hypothetical protein
MEVAVWRVAGMTEGISVTVKEGSIVVDGEGATDFWVEIVKIPVDVDLVVLAGMGIEVVLPRVNCGAARLVFWAVEIVFVPVRGIKGAAALVVPSPF